MIALVASKREWLEGLAPSDLLRLPGFQTEEIVLGTKIIKLTVWHDVLETEEHRFVVQAVDDSGALGYATADGFAQCSKGIKRPLTSEELMDFT